MGTNRLTRVDAVTLLAMQNESPYSCVCWYGASPTDYRGNLHVKVYLPVGCAPGQPAAAERALGRERPARRARAEPRPERAAERSGRPVGYHADPSAVS